MTGRRILAVVFGVLFAVLGITLIGGATAVLVEDTDADGFYMSEQYAFAAPTRAIVSEEIALLNDAPSWLSDSIADPVDLRVRSIGASSGSLFLGIGDSADVTAYLNDVPYHEVTSVDFDGGAITGVSYQVHPATQVPAAPGDQQFWAAWTESTGPQSLEWPLEAGSWTVVAMNSDGSTGVAADLVFGARMANLTTIAWVAAAIGMVLAVGGGFLIYLGVRRRTETVDLGEGAPTVTEQPVDGELVRSG